MSQIIDWFFAEYKNVPNYIIYLELTTIGFGLLSACFSNMNNSLIYPAGIVSTAIFVYLLGVYGLLGGLVINAYYFSMSVYGWYFWTRKVDEKHYVPITKMTKKEKQISAGIFIGAIILIYV